MSTTSIPHSRPGSIVGEEPASAGTKGTGGTAKATGGGKGHAPTQCACGKEGRHYSEIQLSGVFPSTPEKVYNLMFTSEWLKTWMTESQRLKGELHLYSPVLQIEISPSTVVSFPYYLQTL